LSKKEEWFKLALYDLETARVMFETGRYRYVPFMCQQAIEKVIKGIISETLTPPRIHNLVRLSKLAGINFTTDEIERLDILSDLYMKVRYPDLINVSKTRAKKLLNFTEQVCQQLLKEKNK
jgi:HEPN domain-containing protein